MKGYKMLAVIWQDLRAERENSILLFESAEQMAAYIKCEHKLTLTEYQRIKKDKYAVICPDAEGKDRLIGDDDAIHDMGYPRGSVSYTMVDCNDQREWDIT